MTTYATNKHHDSVVDGRRGWSRAEDDMVTDSAPDYALLKNNASRGKSEISCEYECVLE
jgi:hypothetical protein